MTTTAEPALRRRAPLLAVFAANAISVCGTTMTFLAIPWFVLETTGSTVQTGLVAGVEFAAVVASSVLAGPAVARLGARRASVLSDLLAALAVAAIPLLHLTAGLAFWQLLALAVLLGLTRAPGDTARATVVPVLAALGGTPIERAASATDGVSRLARMFGAPLAGVLIAVTGAAEVLLVDAGTFLLSAALVALFVPAGGGAASRGAGLRGYLADLRTGLSYLRRDRLIAGITLMLSLTNMFDIAFSSVLLPLYAKDVLDSSVALGLLSGIFGGGAALGTLVYAWLGPRLPRWPVFTAVFLLVGAPRLVVFALEPGLPVLLVTMAVGGVLCGAINPILAVVEYERVPEDLRPTVLGVGGAGSSAGMPLGALLAGFAAQALGLPATLLLLAALYLVITLCPLVFPVWRRMDPA
ncbi:MFS family permease [Crossiella equi]|uniref:MFS family permease n=1 Tax=Crossiella equi TaxID=130796 RepID=A0ABS5A8T4_9PSEU|nr:MFS transporter [Crossiella equi]MBP2472682.1 MFS family permease [Crossiella equi]